MNGNRPLACSVTAAIVAGWRLIPDQLQETCVPSSPPTPILIIGAGPAGLMAAETLANAGWPVEVCDAMPSVGRKFLLAGVGGMNLTHSEPAAAFRSRYREARDWVGDWLEQLDADQLREWAQGLGIDTFVGSSGRVFPRDMKAAPLLRAWLRRLRALGVQIHTRQRWLGWSDDGQLRFSGPGGDSLRQPRATLLALGGGSWARLGSDGSWVPLLRERGVEVRDLLPANCGFLCNWSEHLRQHCAGQPLKSVEVHLHNNQGQPLQRRGEFMLSQDGVEGSLIYAVSAELREQLLREGQARLWLDLTPDRSQAQLQQWLEAPRNGRSLGKLLRGKPGLDASKIALLHELTSAAQRSDPAQLAACIKRLPLTLTGLRPLDEAISSAGGICRHALTDGLMLKALPGVFCAGEMLDWEAPTGGYLLTACFASGKHAALGMLDWLNDST